MKTFRQHIFLLIIGFFPANMLAQEISYSKIIESIIESHANKPGNGTDVALIIEDLEYLAENPININASNFKELSRLYILNTIQINKLLNYIHAFGPAFTIYELQSIDGFTKDMLQKLQPFVYFGDKQRNTITFKAGLKQTRHQLLMRGLGNIQIADGYRPNKEGSVPFEGNRFRYYTRYNFEAGYKLSMGFTAEKDPGEAFFKGSNKHGFDYNSAHISYTLSKRVENITVGDFIIRAGQGLVIWQGYTSGKSENVLSIAKTGQNIRGYTSVDENLYFRGATSTFKLGDGKISLFYSRRNADANIVSDSTNNYFTSLQTSGYHRTQGEIEDEKSVSNTNLGGIMTWHFNHLKIGATFVYQRFDIPYIRIPQLYNQFRFKGNENYTAGADYLYSKGKYQLFGEIALSKSKGKAIVQGAVAHLNDQLSFSTLFRHFDKDYHALWANTFAEGSTISNESGLYFGAKFLPAKYITVSAYSDVYRSNWFNYTTAGPAKNRDIFAQVDFRFSKTIQFYLRYKNEEKEQKFKADQVYVNLPERIQKSRIHFQYKPTKTLLFKTRAELVNYKGQIQEDGYLIYQDIQYSTKNIPLRFSARLAYFKTDSYRSRIYAYENDILYNFSIPAYFGHGFRKYLNLKYKISDRTEFWLKLANTHWTDREVISSGYNKITGNNKTDLKLQLRLKF